MEIDSNPSLHSKIHTEPIDLPKPTTTNNIIIAKSYDNSKHSVTPIITKKTMTRVNQNQRSTNKYSHISCSQSRSITPTTKKK